jgi:hypothetical protein
VIAAPRFAGSRHAPPWSSITVGATHRALMGTEQVDMRLIHTGMLYGLAASKAAVTGAHTSPHYSRLTTGYAGPRHPGRLGRRQISQVRARAR